MEDILTELKRFLDASFYRGSYPVRPDLKKGLYPFVTISREFGVGGKDLAKSLVSRLSQESDPVFNDWKIFDRRLCESIIQEPALKSSIDSLLSEDYHTEVESLVLSLLGRRSVHRSSIQHLFEAIRTLATFGKVIIVGRAGSCITRSLPLGVHIRVVASRDSRLKGISSGEDEDKIKILRKKDLDRAKLVRTHFGEDISSPKLYDAVWNKDRVSFEFISSATVELIKQRWEDHALESLRVVTSWER